MTLRRTAIPIRILPPHLKRFIEEDETKACVICRRGLTSPEFVCHVIEGGGIALHPEDEALYEPDAGDLGLRPVGVDCLRMSAGFREYCKPISEVER